jgi:hypothetical protein
VSEQPIKVVVQNRKGCGCGTILLVLFLIAWAQVLWERSFGEDEETTARPRVVERVEPRESSEPGLFDFEEQPSTQSSPDVVAPSPAAVAGVRPPVATSLTVAKLERDLGGDCPPSALRRGTVLQCVKTGGDDAAGLLILILDDEGNYDFDVGDTTINSTSGLFCRDLVALETPYFYAVAYWFDQGLPQRMDADGNGIPCETVYDAIDVRDVWRNAR